MPVESVLGVKGQAIMEKCSWNFRVQFLVGKLVLDEMRKWCS